MEGISILLVIVGIVFGILQIILFFKIWGMTNDVAQMTNDIRKFRNTFMPKNRDDVMREILKGNPKIGDYLFNALYTEVYNERYEPTKLASIIAEYKALYERAEIPFPKVFEELKTCRDVEKLIWFEE